MSVRFHPFTKCGSTSETAHVIMLKDVRRVKTKVGIGEGMKPIGTALVVGAGLMGHGFAQIFAMNDLDVILVDKTDQLLDVARRWIQGNLHHLTELGEIESHRVEAVSRNIQFSTDLTKSAREADYVLEAVNEDFDLKRSIFEQLDKVATSDAILASNTSSFDINDLGSVKEHPERVIGTHWFFPPQITPCVEIIPSNVTSQKTIDRTVALMERIGKVPTLCKSAPGFVANRIQYAMVAEALAIVEEGLATPQAVDRIVKTSFGFRLGAYGPFEIIDQAGLDIYSAVFEYLYSETHRERFLPPAILDNLIEQGRLGLKTQGGFYNYENGAVEALKRERDRKLYTRLRLLRDELKGHKEK